MTLHVTPLKTVKYQVAILSQQIFEMGFEQQCNGVSFLASLQQSMLLQDNTFSLHLVEDLSQHFEVLFAPYLKWSEAMSGIN